MICSECGSTLTNPRQRACKERCARERATKQKKQLRERSTPLADLEYLPESYWKQVEITGFCWLWKGYLDQDGYGRFTLRNLPYAVHKASYLSLVGSAPMGKVIDHLCRVRNCVNPDHLEFVQAGVNTLRGFSPPMVRQKRSTCPNGHPRASGTRCSVCEATRNRARRDYLNAYMRVWRKK